MTVNLGGVVYPIEVADRFSATLAKLEGGLDRISKKLDDLKTSAKAGPGYLQQRLQQLTSTFQKLDGSVRASSNNMQKNLAQQNAALASYAQAQRNAAASQTAFNSSLRQQASAIAGSSRGIRQLTGAYSTLSSANAKLASSNQILQGSFARLVGAFVTYRLLFGSLSFSKTAITSAIEFNAQIEQAEVGIAALVSSLAELRNAQGDQLEGADKFVAAQILARDQLQKLRRDAIATTATFEDLLFTFQVGLGPGIGAGFDLDQIRLLAVRISQAAQAIRLPQNQLQEEIRSILSGTIQQRTTRIAAVLGITNEDIRRWKDLGTLAEELFSRFEAFEQAGLRTETTFSGMAARIKDAFQIALGQGFEPLFNKVKEFLVITRRGLLGDEGTAASPETIRVLRGLGEALGQVIDDFVRFGSSISGEELKSVFDGIANAIRTTSSVFFLFAEGAVKAFRVISAAAAPFVAVISAILGFRGIGADITKAAGALVAMAAVSSVIAKTWKTIQVLVLSTATQGIVRAVVATGVWVRSIALAAVGIRTTGFYVDALGVKVAVAASQTTLLARAWAGVGVAIRASLGPLAAVLLILAGGAIVESLIPQNTTKELEDAQDAVEKMLKDLREVPFTLSDSESIAKKIEAAFAEIGERAKEAGNEFKKAAAALRGFGEGSEEAKAAAEAEIKAEEQLSAVQAQRITLLKEIAQLEAQVEEQRTGVSAGLGRQATSLDNLTRATRLYAARAQELVIQEEKLKAARATNRASGRDRDFGTEETRNRIDLLKQLQAEDEALLRSQGLGEEAAVAATKLVTTIARLVGLRKEQEGIESEIAKLTKQISDAAALELATRSASRLATISRENEELELRVRTYERLAAAQTKEARAAAERENRADEIRTRSARGIREAVSELEQIDKQLAKTSKDALTAEQRKIVEQRRAALLENIRLQGVLASAEAEKEITREKKEQNRQTSEQVYQEIQRTALALAAAETFLKAEQLRTKAQASDRGNPLLGDSLRASADVLEAQANLTRLQVERGNELIEIARRLERSEQAGLTGKVQALLLLGLQVGKEQEYADKIAKANFELERRRQALEEIRRIQAAPVASAIEDAFDALNQDGLTTYQNFLGAVGDATRGFSNTVAQSVVAAFSGASGQEIAQIVGGFLVQLGQSLISRGVEQLIGILYDELFKAAEAVQDLSGASAVAAVELEGAAAAATVRTASGASLAQAEIAGAQAAAAIRAGGAATATSVEAGGEALEAGGQAAQTGGEAVAQGAAGLAAAGSLLGGFLGGFSSSSTGLIIGAGLLLTAGIVLKPATDSLAAGAATLLVAATVLAGASILSGGAAAQGGAVLGFAEGGPVPRSAKGIRHRIRGVDPRDTIPALLRRNEHVMRPESTSYYGHEIFSALNRLMIPAEQVRGLLSGFGTVPIRRVKSFGFAEGGPVSPSGTSSSRAGAASASRALIITDRQFAKDLLRGGRQTMERYTRSVVARSKRS